MFKKTCFIFASIFVILLCTNSSYKHAQSKLYSIKEQTLNLYELIHSSKLKSSQTIKSFEISSQVSYKEYKVYLDEIKKDSSLSYYESELPDKRIGSNETYQEYITGNKYDNYPVLGVSWDNAMNYCKWKTVKDNKDSIRFVYRLPHCSEWIAANYYLSTNKIKNDFNKNYADWTIDTYDESYYDLSSAFAGNQLIDNYMYFHKLQDPKVLKRKRVIGNSYLYQNEFPLSNNFSFYATTGYKHISFRFIKEYISASKENTASSVIKHWKLNTK